MAGNGITYFEYYYHKIPFKAVHACRSKVTRAEPVSALFERNKFTISAQFQSLKIRCENGYQGGEVT